MAEFWLATFEMDASVPDMAGAWAIEIIHDETVVHDETLNEDRTVQEYAVLLSRADCFKQPKKLQCRIGFANISKACSIWHDRGFPLNDAIIEKADGNECNVRCACFLERAEIHYDAPVISVAGLMVAAETGSPEATPLAASYEQSQEAPDYAFPATWIRRMKVGWSPNRASVVRIPPTVLTLNLAAARFPILAPFKSGKITPKAVWHGTMELPKWPPAFVPAPVDRVNRIDEFGPPDFQFEDIEVLGFRLNLDELGVGDDRLLDKMIERLNYHLAPFERGEAQRSRTIRDAIPDFRYCPATRTLMLEMLRYGKMKTRGSPPPLSGEDYQSQHELLVRMLVGRVDDDTAQARDPATFVPTIFVDNPWSKLVGRNVQGFDKWMADFCVSDGATLSRLLPDGRRSADHEPEELASIRQVSLVTETGGAPSKLVLLKLDCPYDTLEDWDSFVPIDLDLALGVSALVPIRWRQDDFDETEYRRSFARSAIPGTLRGFRSIQVSPIGESKLLKKWQAETTLIRGTFTVRGTPQIAMPNGSVALTLCANPSAPPAWKDLCKLLGIDVGGQDTISLTAGNWYRMRCSMDLTVQNSFD
jgi:hypothetical protein